MVVQPSLEIWLGWLTTHMIFFLNIIFFNIYIKKKEIYVRFLGSFLGLQVIFQQGSPSCIFLIPFLFIYLYFFVGGVGLRLENCSK
jgi:hypothetical protein